MINTYLLRPIAGILVRVLYNTRITPNHVTIASIFAGMIAGVMYFFGEYGTIPAAGLFVTLKDILDSADGQLARAKSISSRIGRFLDSIGDLFVNLIIFSAIGWFLFNKTEDVLYLTLSFVAFLGITLRVSYHVYYHVSFLHTKGEYHQNRTIETLSVNDRQSDSTTIVLQRIYQIIYGWQDQLMHFIDTWSRNWEEDLSFKERWFSDQIGLRISGIIGIGTELFLLTICSVFEALEFYVVLNVSIMNGILLTSIFYRKIILRRRLRR